MGLVPKPQRDTPPLTPSHRRTLRRNGGLPPGGTPKDPRGFCFPVQPAKSLYCISKCSVTPAHANIAITPSPITFCNPPATALYNDICPAAPFVSPFDVLPRRLAAGDARRQWWLYLHRSSPTRNIFEFFPVTAEQRQQYAHVRPAPPRRADCAELRCNQKKTLAHATVGVYLIVSETPRNV